MVDSDEPTRRFTILDAIIFIAATACGLSILRAVSALWFMKVVLRPGRPSLIPLLEVGFSVVPCAVAWTAALLVACFIRPRSDVRTMARQPGTLANLTVLASWLIGLCELWGVHQHYWNWGPNVTLHVMSGVGMVVYLQVGLGVAAVWSTLAVGGLWRRAEDWVERAGRVLGVFWMVTAPIFSGYMALRTFYLW